MGISPAEKHLDAWGIRGLHSLAGVPYLRAKRAPESQIRWGQPLESGTSGTFRGVVFWPKNPKTMWI